MYVRAITGWLSRPARFPSFSASRSDFLAASKSAVSKSSMAFLFSWTSLSMTPGSCAADQRATPVTTRNATTANHAEPPRKAPCAEWVWGERLMRSVPSFIQSFSRTARGGVECAPCLLLDDDEFHPPVLFSAGGV